MSIPRSLVPIPISLQDSLEWTGFPRGWHVSQKAHVEPPTGVRALTTGDFGGYADRRNQMPCKQANPQRA